VREGFFGKGAVSHLRTKLSDEQRRLVAQHSSPHQPDIPLRNESVKNSDGVFFTAPRHFFAPLLIVKTRSAGPQRPSVKNSTDTNRPKLFHVRRGRWPATKALTEAEPYKDAKGSGDGYNVGVRSRDGAEEHGAIGAGKTAENPEAERTRVGGCRGAMPLY